MYELHILKYFTIYHKNIEIPFLVLIAQSYQIIF